jgi:hypothetical protein
MGLQLQGASKLNGARQCRHDGPPTESRPCEEQTRAAIQRADRAWRRGPRLVRELCGEHPDRAGWPSGGPAPVKAPDGGSEFSPGSPDSGSGTECSESRDPGSSDPEWDSEPPEAESEGFEPPEAEPEGSESSGSESSETESEDSDSSEAESETPTRLTWRQGEGVRSPPTRALRLFLLLLRLRGVGLAQRRLGLCKAVLIRHRRRPHSFPTPLGRD